MTTTAVAAFNFEGNEVRTVDINGEAWFVAKDVCDVLGYVSASGAIRKHVNEKDKQTVSVGLPGRHPLIINESGLNSLILDSRLTKAEEFRHWVTSDVLPTIRKYGAYMTADTLDKARSNPDFLRQLTIKLEDEQKRRIAAEQRILQQEQLIAVIQPKASYFDHVLDSKGSVNITQIAKDYDISGIALNDLLRKAGIQYKIGGQWVLSKPYTRKGLTRSYTYEIGYSTTQWTQKGRQFIHDFLNELGIQPIELLEEEGADD